MRYSIFEFSQEKLIEYGLDVTDALILNWFTQFYSGKMEKMLFKDEDNATKIFGWVKISKIMEDIPVIGITTEKGIRNRFDKFVEKGILERQTVSTQSGKKSYYRATEIYESLVNTVAKTKKEHSKEKPEEAEKENSVNNVSTISQGNSSSFAKSDISQSPQTTLADKKHYTDSSQSPQNTFANLNNEQKNPQGNSTSFADGNSTSFALNNSQTKDSFFTNSLTKKFNNTAAAITSSITNFFGQNAFDMQFVNKAISMFNLHCFSDNDIWVYFEFIKAKVDKKQANNPRGLAYSLFFQIDVLQEFLNQKQQQLNKKLLQKAESENVKKEKVICPVCYKSFIPDFTKSCPCCDFEMSLFGDEQEIERQRKIFALPEDVRESYLEEIMSFGKEIPIQKRIAYFSSPLGKMEQEKYLAHVNKKYGI